MNWVAVSAIVEIVGVIAVVVSLVYLAVQIRQNSNLARAATRQAIAETTANLATDLIIDSEIADIFVKHINGEALSPVENLRMQLRCYRDMAHWENVRYQFTEGLVSRGQWRGFRSNLAALLEIDAYREYWEHVSFHYSAGFQAEVASVLEELIADGRDARIAARFRHSSGH